LLSVRNAEVTSSSLVPSTTKKPKQTNEYGPKHDIQAVLPKTPELVSSGAFRVLLGFSIPATFPEILMPLPPVSDIARNLVQIELQVKTIRRLSSKEGFTEEDIADMQTAWEEIRDRAEIERLRLKLL
jgi:hypothetical protein